jgi:hypothetical protein
LHRFVRVFGEEPSHVLHFSGDVSIDNANQPGNSRPSPIPVVADNQAAAGLGLGVKEFAVLDCKRLKGFPG